MFESDGVAGHAADPSRSRPPGSGAASAPAVPEPGLVHRAVGTAGMEAFVGRVEPQATGRVAAHDLFEGGRRRLDVVAVPGGAVGAGNDDTRADAAHEGAEPGIDLLALLDRESTGTGLAAALASVDESTLGDHALVEAMAAWERLASWAHAGAARVLAELLGRTAGTPRDEFVADEIAARLGTDRASAGRRVATARGTARLPEVADALAAGTVDRDKAEALLLTGTLRDDVRRAEVRALLPEAGRLTAEEVRERLRRAEIERDPGGTQERHRAARDGRSVRIEPVDDAMARLTVELPADDAVRVFSAVDAAADALREPGDTRPPDAGRADALVGVLTGRLRVEAADRERHPGSAARREPVHGAAAARDRRPVVRAGEVRVTVAASTLLGADDLPAILAGHGPVPAAMARALAGDPDAVWQRIFTDPGSGELVDLAPHGYRPNAELRRAVVAARDVTCTFPGCRVPAEQADVDLVATAATGPEPRLGVGLHAVCAAHRRAVARGGWRAAREAPTGATVWTTPTGRRHRRAPAVVDPRRVPPVVT